MKIGMSIYSISKAIKEGRLEPLQAVEWAADHGAAHLEISPGNYLEMGDPKFVKALKAKAKKCHIPLSSYTIGANFLTAGKDQDVHETSRAEVRKEIERLKKEVDVAAAMGVKLMRHDVGYRKQEDCTLAQFEKDLPKVVKACQEVADYAAQYGITTSVENHGFHFQGSERVRRLVTAVNRPNYKTTIDVGNFLCVDELPQAGVLNNLGIATGILHFKDFIIRDRVPTTEGFIRTTHGRYLRGSVIGFGDVDLYAVSRIIKDARYNGFISVEYEGMEECLEGTRLSLANAKVLLA